MSSGADSAPYGTREAEPEFVAATLKWCNARRAEKGWEPLDRLPLGERMSPLSCPCGKATGLYVWTYVFGETEEDYETAPELPEAVTAFISHFDSGRLPQYDADASRGGVS